MYVYIHYVYMYMYVHVYVCMYMYTVQYVCMYVQHIFKWIFAMLIFSARCTYILYMRSFPFN